MEDTVIENSATLRNRVARVKLRSGTTSGITRVTAFFGSSRETIEIKLVPPGSLSSQGSRVIVIRGEKIKYFPTGNDGIAKIISGIKTGNNKKCCVRSI